MKNVTKIGTDIKTRTISAICIVSVLLSAIIAGTPFFHYFIAVLSGLIFFEWICVSSKFQMRSGSSQNNSSASILKESNRVSFFVAYVRMFFFILLQFFSFFCEVWVFALFAGLLLAKSIFTKFVLNSTRSAISDFGIFYIFLAIGGLGRIYNQTNFLFVLWMFFVIWLTDTGAFFCGKFFGKK
jgi:CDP-diglyceride synthetase